MSGTKYDPIVIDGTPQESKRVLECKICWEPLRILPHHAIPCGDVFHDKCLQTWTYGKTTPTCPLCRMDTRTGKPVQPPNSPSYPLGLPFVPMEYAHPGEYVGYHDGDFVRVAFTFRH